AAPQKDEPKKAAATLIAGKLKIGQCTLTGDVREFNDDAIAVQALPAATLCLVADGMGGVIDGKVVGQIAWERAFAAVTRELNKNLTKEASSEEARNVVRRALVATNAEVIALGNGPAFKNGGTTIVLALFRPGHEGAIVAGIGDSRAYRVTDEKIEQL